MDCREQLDLAWHSHSHHDRLHQAAAEAKKFPKDYWINDV